LTSQPDKSDDSSGQCAQFADAIQTGRLKGTDAEEISGLALSRKTPGLLWAHNDGDGDNAKLYAIHRDAELRAEFPIHDFDIVDLEDIAFGPGPDPDIDYLYLADTGDNGNDRDEIQVLRIPEPTLDRQGEILRDEVEVFRFVYDDSDPHDAEAIMVDPDSGEIYIVTKHGPDERRTRVYKSERTLDPVNENPLLEVLRDSDVPELAGSVVAGDISLDGSRIALLFKDEATRVWTRDAGESITETLRKPACHAPSASGQQEALAWTLDGEGFYLLPEGQEPQLSFVTTRRKCPEVSAVSETGPVLADSLEEVSGLVLSAHDPDLLWAINDSGRGDSRNHISALSRDGQHLGDIPLASIENEDWEDIAIGPGPIEGQGYLYVADIGDNDLERGNIEVHRFVEPSVGDQVDEIETFTFEYPNDRPHDAESIFVDPVSADLYIVTRQRSGDEKTRVYRAKAPLDSSDKIQLKKVLDDGDNPDLNQSIVAADISADGSTIALARRDGVPLVYERNPEGPAFEALHYRGCRAQSFPGKQDSVALEQDGSGYFQLSEGQNPILFHAEFEAVP
jgi:hypothetical protein